MNEEPEETLDHPYGLEVRAERPIYGRRAFVNLYFWAPIENYEKDEVWALAPLRFRKESSLSELNRNNRAITLTDPEAQRLMDQLWDCGLRPTEGAGTAGSLKATEAHLATAKEYANRLLVLIEKRRS